MFSYFGCSGTDGPCVTCFNFCKACTKPGTSGDIGLNKMLCIKIHHYTYGEKD